MKTIAITNQKGGVGKTTTTLTLGCALAEMGRRVALVGLDSQRDLCGFSDSIEAENLQFFNADAKTLKATLKRAASTCGADGFALLDCPPALGVEVAAALSQSDAVLIPTQAEKLSVQGLGRLMETLNAARDPRRAGANPELTYRLLVTLFDTQNPDSHFIEARLRKEFGDAVLPGVIKRHGAFASAALDGQSILQNHSRIHPANVYRAVARNLVKGWNHA